MVALILVACMPYIRGLTGAFVWDDRTYFLDNDILPFLRPWDLRAILFAPSNYWGEHLPVRDLLFVIQHFLFGESTAGYHAVSLVLYACIGFALFRFLSLLSRDHVSPGQTDRTVDSGPVVSACWVTAFFLLHPVHVESVAYISGQKDLLYSLFTVLALSDLFLISWEGASWRSLRFFRFLAFYYLSLLSKTSAIATAAFVPFFWLVFVRTRGVSLTKFAGAWLLINIPAALWMFHSMGLLHAYQGSTQDILSLSPGATIVRSLRILGAHTALAVKPFPLNFGYPFDETAVPDTDFWIGAWVLTLFAVSLVWKRRALVTLGLALFFFYLFPALQVFVPLGNASIYDRYLFIPVLGLGIVVERMGAAALSRWRYLRQPLLGLSVALLLVLGSLTLSYIPKFRSDVVSTRHAYLHFPDWPTSAFNYVYALIEAGRLDEAREVTLREGTLSHPAWVRGYFLGWIALEQGDRGDAIRFLEQASSLAMSGGYYPFPNIPLGRALRDDGQYDGAMAVLEQALASPLHQPLEFSKAKRIVEALRRNRPS